MLHVSMLLLGEQTHLTGEVYSSEGIEVTEYVF